MENLNNLEQAARTQLEQNKQRRSQQPTVKNIRGKALILQGIVESITPTSSKFGYSWRIKISGFNYYFNADLESTCEKMFEIGKRAVFTATEKPNINNPSHPYLCIAQIFYAL